MLFTTESSYYNKYMTNEKCLITNVLINKTATYLEMKNVQKYLHLLHY